jgi:hypothetical protein
MLCTVPTLEQFSPAYKSYGIWARIAQASALFITSSIHRGAVVEASRRYYEERRVYPQPSTEAITNKGESIHHNQPKVLRVQDESIHRSLPKVLRRKTSPSSAAYRWYYEARQSILRSLPKPLRRRTSPSTTGSRSKSKVVKASRRYYEERRVHPPLPTEGIENEDKSIHHNQPMVLQIQDEPIHYNQPKALRITTSPSTAVCRSHYE